MQRRDVFYFAGECALLLFTCAGIVGTYAAWRAGNEKITAYSVTLGVPATASLALILAALVVPSVVAPGRLVYPLNITLPIVYLPLMLASLVLWTTGRGSIQATPEALEPARMWADPMLLGTSFAAQFLLMTLIAVFRRAETKR